MARYMVERNYVDVVGTIWMPATTASLRIPLRKYDLENIIANRITGDVPVTDINLAERFTRESVERWLGCNSGDFQSVEDFYATAGGVEIPWASEDGEMAYYNTLSEDFE